MPVLISVIVGVTNIIPFFGPFIGAIPSILILLIINPWDALGFAVFVLALQQFDGNILGPKILGDSTGLSAFWVLVAIIVGGGLFGFVGMVVGVPALRCCIHSPAISWPGAWQKRALTRRATLCRKPVCRRPKARLRRSRRQSHKTEIPCAGGRFPSKEGRQFKEIYNPLVNIEKRVCPLEGAYPWFLLIYLISENFL